jgi:hypothetical protein
MVLLVVLFMLVLLMQIYGLAAPIEPLIGGFVSCYVSSSMTVSMRRQLLSTPRIYRQILAQVEMKMTALNANEMPISSLDATDDSNILSQTTIIANTAFRTPTSQHLETFSAHQVHHALTPTQTFCISSHLCQHSHPQSFGFHPTSGTKLSSGLFRLSCPLLVQAIDDWEASGGVRELSDWLLHNDTRLRDNDYDPDWKRKGYEHANEMQMKIREELVSEADKRRLNEKLGDFNAKKFMESGVAGMPPQQTYEVKCIHAHVADHLSRVSVNSTMDSLEDILYGDGNIIGRRALQILHGKGLPILGNAVCWQQCSGNDGWRYIARKNRSGLKKTRLRRRDMKNTDNLASSQN